MVAVVGLAGELREAYRQERGHFDASLAHAFEETAFYTPTAHIVVDDAHFNASFGTGYETVGYQLAEWVVFKDIHIDVYVVLGFGNVAKQGGEELVSVGEQLCAVAIEGK